MITDEMIAEAAAKYNDALIQYWQNVEMEEHEFSSKFERKMRRLIWKVKYPYMHKALRSVACILIAFLISFASVLTFNVEARAAFTRWIREVYEDSIVYEFFGDRSETASLDYRVTWVPDGYELVDEYKSEVLYSLLYQKENPAHGGVLYKTQLTIYLVSAVSVFASAIFSSTSVKGLICTLIVAVTVGFK